MIPATTKTSGPARVRAIHPPPSPYDPVAAERLLARFGERDAAGRAYASSAEGMALLAALGGHSPFLADLALREAPTLLRIAERGPDAVLELALDPLRRADPAASRDAVGALLRQVKRQVGLVTAVADLAGQWPLERVTAALSELADGAIDFAAAHLLLAAAGRGELRLPRAPGRTGRPATPRQLCRGSGLVVLGLGKLGGRELNYSSDIDLMVLYDPHAAAYHADQAGACYVRLARDLVRLLEERTAEGYVFRTDLRLRPDPAATPLAVALPAAIVYYESMGQNWERAALIKARPVAGDLAAGEAFLREIRPFIWRRHLDFAAIADIHAIKRQIYAHKGAKGANARIALAGHDVKLGRGGIREIEFTAQVLQLIWGGRDLALRDPTTLGALAALAGAGKLDRRAAGDLADAYGFLRTLEHRLQMVADRQTHRLPEDEEGLARIASFMGYPDLAAFTAAFMGHLGRVERHYSRLFESAPNLTGEADGLTGSLVFTGVDDDPDTLATLRRMGFVEPGSVAAMVRAWHHGRPRATRSERARELLTALMPALLAAFGRQRQPDQALARFDRLLDRLTTGVQLFSLLRQNPQLLGRLAGILGAAPRLADHLTRHVGALDGLLAGALAPEGADPCAGLGLLVKDARFIDEALDAARRLVTERQFEIDAATLEGTLDADRGGALRSDLADAALGALLPRIAADFAERHGTVPGGALAIVALGKLGGQEMLPGSDLDLVLIYDHAPEATESQGGRRALAPSEYFIRLAHQVVGAITAPGGNGKLYEVDMRLRPSGNKGPVAIRLAAFEQYHRENAWTWERMALTRARPVTGPPALRRRIAAAIAAGIARPGAAAPALADAAAMRARLLKELPAEGPWDVKTMPGGLVEVEFIAQALQIAHAPGHPRVLAQTTRLALARLAKARLLPAEEAQVLIAADRLWRTTIGLLRLTVGRTREPMLPAPVAAALLRSAGPLCDRPPVDLAEFRAQMRQVAGAVRAIFERRVGPLPAPGAGESSG